LRDAAEQESERYSDFVRGDDCGGFEAGCYGSWIGMGGEGLEFGVDPGSAHEDAGFAFESSGEVDDAGSGLVCGFPVLQGELLLAGEEGEIHALERAWLDALDEGDFVTDGFEAAEFGFVIHEEKVGVGERRVGESVIEFFATQRTGSDDGNFLLIGHPVGPWAGGSGFRAG